MRDEESAEEALRAENSRLKARVAELERVVDEMERWRLVAQSTLDALSDIVFARDIENKFVLTNDRFSGVMARSREEILRRRDADLFPPGIIEYLRVLDGEVLSTRRPIEVEEKIPQAGVVHTYIARRFPVIAPDGAVVALGCISTDITTRARAEAALRESQALLQGLLDNSPSVIVVKDAEGRYVTVNRAGERALRREAKELIGKTVMDAFAPEAASPIDERDKRVLETGEPVDVEEVLEMPEGSRVFFNSTFPLRDAGGRSYATCSIVTDITERARQAEEREKLREKMIAAQANALRELSTPLIPLACDVIMMPLIGAIDRVRAAQALETLLHGVSQRRAAIAIVDITGVPNVDAEVAGALVGAARAVELLGATTILTGIRPEVARTLAGLNVDLRGVVTQGTLESGVAYALARREGRAPR